MIRNKDPNLGKICEKFSFETQKAELTKALRNLCNNNEEDESSEEEESDPNIVAGVLNIKFLLNKSYHLLAMRH